MLLASSYQSNALPYFFFSGEIKNEDLRIYEMMVTSLGGRISISTNERQFLSTQCTHVLCFSFFPTVKIMGGLASGKWIVKKEYIEDSYKAGKWLDEEQYEVTDYKQIAKFHRNRRKKLYGRLMCFVEMCDPSMTKCFKRILLAGGALILDPQEKQLKDHVKVKVAITDIKSYQKVEDAVGKSTPIISVDYIKQTIFFKHDPDDLRNFLMNPNSADVSSLGILVKPKEFSMSKDLGNSTGELSPPHSLLSLMHRKLVGEVSWPVLIQLGVLDSLRQLQLSHIKKLSNYTRNNPFDFVFTNLRVTTPYTSMIQDVLEYIQRYLPSSYDSWAIQLRFEGLPTVNLNTEIDLETVVSMVRAVKRWKLCLRRREYLNHQQELSIFNKLIRPHDESLTTPTTPTKARIRRRTQTMSFTPNSSHRNIASYFLKKMAAATKAKNEDQNKKPRLEDYSYTSSEIEFIKEVKPPPPKESECYLIDDDDIDEVKQEHPVVCSKDVASKEVITTEFSSTASGSDSSQPLKCLEKDDVQSSVIDTKPTHLVDKNLKESSMTLPSLSTVEQTKRVLQEKENNVCALGRTETRPQTSEPLLQPLQATPGGGGTFPPDENVALTKEKDDSEPSRESPSRSIFKANRKKILENKSATIIVRSDRMRKIISSFLIRLNTSHYYLSSSHIPFYPYSTSGIKASRELGADESLYASTIQDEDLRVISKRIGRHKVMSVEREKQCKLSAEDRLVALQSLEWLQLRIQLDIFPNTASLGAMCRSHILECHFKDVSDRALCIFQSIINLHPPYNRKMRDYYLKVLQVASEEKEETHSQFKGWTFVSRIIEDLLRESSEVHYDVHTTVDCVLRLLELDLLHYNESPISVTSLFSYRMWWVGVNQNPSVVNGAVRELIQLWIKSAEKDILTRRKVTNFVSIMLEMVWKWSDFSNPFLLSEWPMHGLWMPVANEIVRQLAEMEDKSNSLLLVKYVKGHMQQMLLTSFAIRALSPTNVNLDLSLPSLKSALVKEMGECSGSKDEEKSTSASSHEIRVQLLMLLMVAFIHSTGIKYCKETLTRQFKHTLRMKGVLVSHPESSFDRVERRSRDETSSSSVPGEKRIAKANGTATEISAGNDTGQKRKLDRLCSNSCDNSDSIISASLPPAVEKNEAEELNPSVKVMVENTMKYFRLLPPLIEELEAVRLKCTHMVRWPFHQAL